MGCWVLPDTGLFECRLLGLRISGHRIFGYRIFRIPDFSTRDSPDAGFLGYRNVGVLDFPVTVLVGTGILDTEFL